MTLVSQSSDNILQSCPVTEDAEGIFVFLGSHELILGLSFKPTWAAIQCTGVPGKTEFLSSFPNFQSHHVRKD